MTATKRATDTRVMENPYDLESRKNTAFGRKKKTGKGLLIFFIRSIDRVMFLMEKIGNLLNIVPGDIP
ncbi:hypothetical protein [Azospirillum doebereinerae]|uniref:hypothetical protein n=1 Tax=Azospirillum doebereinerae TaxID=92933 RepID=UPI00163C2C10|nr:hypothetical protein [Azospirillum doebereinerae]MCG5239644.1 hypothetical protein [Azospirillum doebereinerae]